MKRKGEELIPLQLVQGGKHLKGGQGQSTCDAPTQVAKAWVLLTGWGVGNAGGGDSALDRQDTSAGCLSW